MRLIGSQPAALLAIALPAALLAGALGSQWIGGLYPCELCHWQRWPHYAALAIALVGALLNGRTRRAAILLAGIAIAISGAIGAYHAGIEYGWWPNLAPCASTMQGGGTIEDILSMPIVSCDQPQWTLAGISLAGFNAIFSLGGAITIFGLLRNERQA